MTEYMTDNELALANAENVSMIKYYTLPGGIRGLILMRGRNVPINLCEGDKGFGELEKLALAAYEANPDTAADEAARNLLERRSRQSFPECLDVFADIEGSFLRRVTFGKNFVNACQPFLYYFLGEIYEGLGAKAEFIGDISGYTNRYAVKCRVNGREKTLPLSVKRKGTKAEFTAGNILGAAHSAEISFACSDREIFVTAKSRTGREILREYSFDIYGGAYRLRIFDGGLVYDKKREIQPLKEENADENFTGLVKVIENVCNVKLENADKFPLPWGGIGIAHTVGGTRSFIAADFGGKGDNRVNTGNTAAAAVIRHFYREYADFSEDSQVPVTVFSFNAVHEIFPGQNLIQTEFIHAGEFTSGLFKECFEGRYFIRKISD
ncbi:MAG: hypothetical protein NC078_11085 [Ruminococcus sp.]|nr:hypothetical protein [Ruminococcus sp.]